MMNSANLFEKSLHSFMSDTKFYMDYSRWRKDDQRYETWSEAVDRVFDMHIEKIKSKGIELCGRLKELMEESRIQYKTRRILGAQRALQFGGPQILKHEAKIYNCATTYADRKRFFAETMYLLLCGCGTGFSVQKHHIMKLPVVNAVTLSDTVTFVVEDSIEGWSESVDALICSYMDPTSPYFGRTVHFDYSMIRPKGSEISGGFTAPGPDGLAASLEDIRRILKKAVRAGARKLRSIEIYDIVMFIARAVLSGGVRRAATICVFSKDDEDMMTAKTGSWYVNNKQREYSNNSALLVRDDLTEKEFLNFKQSVKEFGEPGFVLSESDQIMFNPCVEIGMIPELLTYFEVSRGKAGDVKDYFGLTPEENSGWQFCNLCDVNATVLKSREEFLQAVRAAATLGTIQALYTNFKFLTDVSSKITIRDSLIGVGITGWMGNVDLMFDPELLRSGAELVKEINEEVAAILEIPSAARTTTVKPSGNSSVLLSNEEMCPSGCHGEHSPYYFRTVTMAKTSAVYKLIAETNPKMVEDKNSDPTSAIVYFPIVAKKDAKFKKDLMGVDQLKAVKLIFENWVLPGTRPERSRIEGVTHNVSNTITVDDWDAVFDYILENKKSFAGVSMMGEYGDRSYPQAPFCGVYPANELIEMYGDCAVLASGLVVDGLSAYDGDLWMATATARGFGLKLDETNHKDLNRRDWVRRFNQFAERHLGNDIARTDSLLKDVYNLHRWMEITQNFKPINYVEELSEPRYVVAGSDAGAACSGGVCEII